MATPHQLLSQTVWPITVKQFSNTMQGDSDGDWLFEDIKLDQFRICIHSGPLF